MNFSQQCGYFVLVVSKTTNTLRKPQKKGLLQKSVESRLSTALFVSKDFKLEKTITR